MSISLRNPRPFTERIRGPEIHGFLFSLEEAPDRFRGSPDSPDRIFELHFVTLEFFRPVFDLIGFMRIDSVVGVRTSHYFFIAHEFLPRKNLQRDDPIAELDNAMANAIRFLEL